MTYKYEPQSLRGKRVLLTGGTTGIGRAIVLRLLADGAQVLTFGINEVTLQDALADFEPCAERNGGSIRAIVADQSKANEIQRVFAEADATLGGLDILINNAAIGASSVEDTDHLEIQRAIDTNLTAYLSCSHEAILRIKENPEGHIINIGSMSAEERGAGSDLYVATKSALRGFSTALRRQLIDKNIRVTLIEPGLVGTDLTAQGHPPAVQPAAIAAGTMLMAEDLAECVHYILVQPTRCAINTVQIEPIKTR